MVKGLHFHYWVGLTQSRRQYATKAEAIAAAEKTQQGKQWLVLPCDPNLGRCKG